MSSDEDLEKLDESRKYKLAELDELIKTSPKPWMFLRRCGLFQLMGEKEFAYKDIETAWEIYKSSKSTKVKARVLERRSEFYKSYEDLPGLRDSYESQFVNYKAMPESRLRKYTAFREFLGNYGDLLAEMNVEREKANTLIRQAISLYDGKSYPSRLNDYLEGLNDVHEMAEIKSKALEEELSNPPPDTQKKKNKKKKEKTVSKSAENSSDVKKEIISSNVGETSEASISTTRIISSNVADYENRKASSSSTLVV
ncbi:uncharacterized protein LOC126671879 [Mercurialis annua]|uniref:uncharacterized protein LOC126671879 n=1 Tax=Mercurialis annua TaxID=3986 RepID=UPI0024AD91BA|nr:uncharacterized protein LOC126671879 [Mercurialis annua]